MSGTLDGYFCTPKLVLTYKTAKVAHLVEHDLAKVGVAGSSPVFRSRNPSSFGGGIFFASAAIALAMAVVNALVVELVDTQDLKSCGQQCP